jgi:plastocyanin
MNKLLALSGVLLILVTAAAAIGVLDSGSGSGSGSGGAGAAASGTTAAGKRVRVPIVSFAFVPKVLHVAVGAKVTWTNEDSSPHTATADDAAAFDTGTLTRHASKTITFSKAGTFAYHCAFHPFMTATVTVG